MRDAVVDHMKKMAGRMMSRAMEVVRKMMKVVHTTTTELNMMNAVLAAVIRMMSVSYVKSATSATSEMMVHCTKKMVRTSDDGLNDWNDLELRMTTKL